MADLIEELKEEHSVIKGLFLKVREAGLLTREGYSALQQTKFMLFDHVQKEDEELYPAMKKAAAREKELSKLINNFAMEMEEISSQVMAFLLKYPDKTASSSLKKEFEELMEKIEFRISREEETLFPEYEKLTGKA